MKIGEKLIELRKNNGLSQEQLAEKLNVTRQTISKWELGVSKPDIEKINEICKEFNIPVNEFMDENNVIEKEKNVIVKKKKVKNRKVILYFFWLLLIACVGFLGYRVADDVKNDKKNFFRPFNSIVDNIKDNVDIAKSSFNRQFEIHAGEISGTFLESSIADLITSNKKYSEHQIEFIMEGVSFGTDTDKIQAEKEKVETSKKYELSFNYGDDGYINQFIVTEKDVSVYDFNFGIESRAGSSFGTSLKDFISTVANHNQKYPKHQIVLEVFGISYGTTNTNMVNGGKMLDDWTTYNASFEYDANGYITKLIIIK